jgi:hypothetical protein
MIPARNRDESREAELARPRNWLSPLQLIPVRPHVGATAARNARSGDGARMTTQATSSE